MIREVSFKRGSTVNLLLGTSLVLMIALRLASMAATPIQVMCNYCSLIPSLANATCVVLFNLPTGLSSSCAILFTLVNCY